MKGEKSEKGWVGGEGKARKRDGRGGKGEFKEIESGRGEGIGDAKRVWWQGRRVAAKRVERQKKGKGEV